MRNPPLLHASLLLFSTARAWSKSHSSVAMVLSQPTPSGAQLPAAHVRAKIAHSVAASERRAQERIATSRPLCESCERPAPVCVCAAAPPQRLHCRTQIVILQHPNERRRKNFSTVPLIKRVLANVEVKVAYTFTADHLPWLSRRDGGQKPLLLYPSEKAVSLESLCTQQATDKLPLNNVSPAPVLILLDGTWAEAKRMARDSPHLIRGCQTVQFSNVSEPSIYNAVRKEPGDHCLSTLEAVSYALDLIEGEHSGLNGCVKIMSPSDISHTSTETLSTPQEYLRKMLECHIKSHLINARQYESRSAGKAQAKLYQKNKRRREIERAMFLNEKAWTDLRMELLPSPTMQQECTTPTINSGADNHSVVLPDGAILRRLNLSDASKVNSWWEHRSRHSLRTVERRIGKGAASLGIECDGQLIACIVQYEFGTTIGMLYVEEPYRRRGYALQLVRSATRNLMALKKDTDIVTFIVDGNHASSSLFARAGWVREDSTLKRGTGRRRSKRKWVYRAPVNTREL